MSGKPRRRGHWCVDALSPEGRARVLERWCRTYYINSGALMGETQDVYRRLETKVLVKKRQYSSSKRLTRRGYFIPTVWPMPKCIGGVTNPMKNHSSMILPTHSISYPNGQIRVVLYLEILRFYVCLFFFFFSLELCKHASPPNIYPPAFSPQVVVKIQCLKRLILSWIPRFVTSFVTTVLLLQSCQIESKLYWIL